MGIHWTAGWHWQSYLFHENSLISDYITAMLQVVCVLYQPLKVSAPHSRNFRNVPTTFDLLFLPYLLTILLNEKIWLVDVVLRQSFDRKLIFPNVFRDVQTGRNHSVAYQPATLHLPSRVKFTTKFPCMYMRVRYDLAAWMDPWYPSSLVISWRHAHNWNEEDIIFDELEQLKTSVNNLRKGRCLKLPILFLVINFIF